MYAFRGMFRRAISPFMFPYFFGRKALRKDNRTSWRQTCNDLPPKAASFDEPTHNLVIESCIQRCNGVNLGPGPNCGVVTLLLACRSAKSTLHLKCPAENRMGSSGKMVRRARAPNTRTIASLCLMASLVCSTRPDCAHWLQTSTACTCLS